MKFAKLVYSIAAIYGLIVLVPQYFFENRNGIQFPPPINHPEYYYGFVGIAVAWQVAFLIISRDPRRYRTLMIATWLEKFSYAIAAIILYAQSRLATAMLAFGSIDLVLGILFVLAYIKTRD